MNAFKAYDIRGVYNRDFNREDVYRIGCFLPRLLNTGRVLVGRDGRTSSPEIFEALTGGIRDAGADAVSIGLATTPEVYFTTARHRFDASVMITASHNPREYNGLKVSRTGALPVGYDSGLADLEKMMQTEPVPMAETRGALHELDVRREYLDFFAPVTPDLTDLNVGIDCSNGMVSLLIREILGDKPVYINDELDCTFPNHEPNPLIEENDRQMEALVRDEHLDVGVIYDGDGDRVMFVDERGRFVPPDAMIALLGHHYLKDEKGIVLHDIRTSRSAIEHIRELGGEPYMWKVGHAFAKRKMRELGAIYGGELAGHYYFREFFNCDSGILASLRILRIVAELKQAGDSLAAWVDRVVHYANSGEMNFRIERKTEAMEALRRGAEEKAAPDAVFDFDGYRIEYPDWWFSVRPSNTEPYLRLIVEANTPELLDQKKAGLHTILEPFLDTPSGD